MCHRNFSGREVVDYLDSNVHHPPPHITTTAATKPSPNVSRDVHNPYSNWMSSLLLVSWYLSDCRYPPEVEGTDKMVELIQSYRELCSSIDRVANRPFDPKISVQANDFPVGPMCTVI